jgi:quinol monooxygenase YgiN
MIYNNVVLTAKDRSDVEGIKDGLRELARQSLEEPGCVRFDVFHSETNPCFFILIEEWDSQAHLDAHRDAPAFKDVYMPTVVPLVERAPHPSRRLWPPE